MLARDKRSKCLESSLLTITVAACVSLLYFYLENTGEQSKNTSPPNGFPAKEMLSEEECVPVCNSKECVIYAKLLLKNMKPHADPCENVNTFACGAYKEQFTKNKEQFNTEVTNSILQDSQINLFKTMNDILGNIEADPDTASGKLKTMYDSCMNLAPMEKKALSTAEKFLRDVGIPDWPNLAPDFQFLGTDIPTIVGNMKGRGEIQFLMFTVPETKSESYNQIHNLTLNMDLRYYGNLLEFQKMSPVVEILKFFKLDDHSIDEIWCDYTSVRKSIINVAEESCKNVTDFLSCPDDEKIKKTKHKNCGNVCNPFFNEQWLSHCYTEESFLDCSHQGNKTDDVCKFIEAFLNNSQLEDDYRINKEIITLIDPPFLKNTFQVLKNFTDRTVANFLALNFYLSHIDEMNFYFRLTHYKYFSPKRCEFYKPSRTMARWRDCTEWTIRNMFFAAQYEFLNKYLTLEETDKVISIFEEYKSELAEAVAHQDWVRQEDKEFINIEGLNFNFNHLKRIRSGRLEYEHSVNDYYKKFHPSGKKFLYDAMELRSATPELLLQLSPIDLSLIKEKFENSPFFDDRCDEVVFYFGHMTPIHYMPGLPRVMNLLATGVYLSHELGHNFDLDIMFGIERNITFEKRKERELCLINQYSNFKYEFEDKNLNGKQFWMENNADSIYAFILDKIIEKYVSAHEEILLPGFNHTFKQMAYIITNEIFCERVTDDWEWYFRNEHASHSPSRLRSIGTMQNSKGFSEAFNCPEGSYMNPSTKCAMLDDF